MGTSLRVLLVEDSEADAYLLVHHLRKGGYDPRFVRVETADAMRHALESESWNIVISDYVVPGFGGLEALHLLKSMELDLPFIMVSGQMGEEVAVDAMKAGAHDYIVKGHLDRLVPAIERELRDAEVRRARRGAEAHIRRQYRQLSALRTVDMAISSSTDVRVTLSVLLDKVTSELRVDAASVLRFNPHTQKLEFIDGRGFETDALRHTRLRFGVGHAGRAAATRQILSVPDLSEDPGAFAQSPGIRGEGFVTYYAVPLVARGTVQGVLELFHRSLLTPDQTWLEFLENLAGQGAIAIDNASMLEELRQYNLEITMAYDATIEGWARTLELRDLETKGHTQRVTEMTLVLAHKMSVQNAMLAHIRRGAVLHDIGKMAIPDGILLKPGELTDAEWTIMRRHPQIAFELLSSIPFLRPAIEIPLCHHERWDGGGYPRGLKGDEIPKSARIFSVVDVWDALRSSRPYKAAWSAERAREHIRDHAGTQFDPEVVEAFLAVDWESEVEFEYT